MANSKGLPAAKSSDGGGERTGRIVNGVAMGKQDGCGRSPGAKETGEMNSGRQSGNVYTHKKGC